MLVLWFHLLQLQPNNGLKLFHTINLVGKFSFFVCTGRKNRRRGRSQGGFSCSDGKGHKQWGGKFCIVFVFYKHVRVGQTQSLILNVLHFALSPSLSVQLNKVDTGLNKLREFVLQRCRSVKYMKLFFLCISFHQFSFMIVAVLSLLELYCFVWNSKEFATQTAVQIHYYNWFILHIDWW